MTREELIRMAREAGIEVQIGEFGVDAGWRKFEMFVELVAAAEREECAKVAWDKFGMAGRHIAGSIRARGQA